MELKEIIKDRRSIKVFKEQPVSADLIQELLRTAVWVPNHKMTQPWRFILVQGESKKKLAEASRTFNAAKERDPEKKNEAGQRAYDKLKNVPMFLIVVMKEDPNISMREEDYAATSCLIHNFSLLAWEQGIGMIWETYGMIHSHEFRNAAGVAPGERIVGSLHIGYPEKIPSPRERKPLEELLTILP
ncbi:Nitroreductase [Bacillus sp. OV322]|uniref:nitroreductase family protein n=1 Tax=Bacillus sp. OV322 TaxID=1882764 RepID=UPI0008EC5EC6|nr:nitroreductase [Bacillus sp. OV322]SFC87847.1 Nitroreductase [Bacillus sp. OV322]